MMCSKKVLQSIFSSINNLFAVNLSNILLFLKEAYTSKSVYKIADIRELSDIPGNTKFIVQIYGKNFFTTFSAKEIKEGSLISKFNSEEQELIHSALSGNLRQFLSKKKMTLRSGFSIISKEFDKKINEHIFTIYSKQEDVIFKLNSKKLAERKDILQDLNNQEVFDVGYTSASDNVIKADKAIKKLNNTIIGI